MFLQRLGNHIVTSFVAGIVALLPVVGLAITVVYFENHVAGVWLKAQGFYFFGLGILLATLLVYLVGLTVSTLVGRWVWGKLDRVIERLPVLGKLYQTLKQILGYGEGPGAVFQRVVMVALDAGDRHELGLVTREASIGTGGKVVVFLPTAPAPTSGRLVYVDPARLEPSSLTASQAMQLIVSLGSVSTKNELQESEDRQQPVH
jgi:uncharacterized membrane protein